MKQRLRQWFESQGGIKVGTNQSSDGHSRERTNSKPSNRKTDTVQRMSMMQLSDDEQYRSFFFDLIVPEPIYSKRL